MNFLKATLLTIILSSVSTSSLAAIYKCDISGTISYQSTPCDGSNKLSSTTHKIPSKSKAVKNCENAFNKCLSGLNPTLYKEGKDYCTARLELCTARSKKEAPEILKLRINKVNFLANRYNRGSSNIAQRARLEKHQSKLAAIDSEHNERIKVIAEESYNSCFKRLSSSIRNVRGASNSLKRACANGMKSSCNFGLQKLAASQCKAKKDTYLQKWLKH